MLNPIIKKKWLNALRSGKFKQGRKQLQCEDSFCCIGVLCKITGNAHNRDMSKYYPTGYLPMDFIGISGEALRYLANLNDNKCKSFAEIADWIEENL